MRNDEKPCGIFWCDNLRGKNTKSFLCGPHMHIKRTFGNAEPYLPCPVSLCGGNFAIKPLVGPNRHRGQFYRSMMCEDCEIIKARYNLKNKNLGRMGTNVFEYISTLRFQNFTCWICEEPETVGSANGSGIPRRLSIDHDHKCCPQKEFLCGRCNRGLLCGVCNIALGLIETSKPQLLSGRFAEYVDHFSIKEIAA